MKYFAILILSVLSIAARAEAPKYNAKCFVMTTGPVGADIHILAEDITVSLSPGEHADLMVTGHGMVRLFFDANTAPEKAGFSIEPVIADPTGLGLSSTRVSGPTMEGLPEQINLLGPNVTDVQGPHSTYMACKRTQ